MLEARTRIPQLVAKPSTGLIVAHAAHGMYRDSRPRRSEEHREVVRDDVQLAVVPRIAQAREPAFLSSQGTVLFQEERDAPPYPAGADDAVEEVRPAVHGTQPAHVPAPPKSQPGFSARGCRAVSMVAVIMASGCSCSRVMGYSATGGEKRATRSAVCFQDPVSL